MPSTAPYDHPSGHSLQTPLTARRQKGGAPGEVAYRQPLKVAHQKVNLDVDLANQIVHGETEIAVLALELGLRQVKLDCRNIQVEEVLVNNKRALFQYSDFHQNDEYMNNPEHYTINDLTPGVLAPHDPLFNPLHDIGSKNFDVHQHHLYKGKFHPIYGNTNHLEELNINTDSLGAQQSYHHPYTPLLLTNTEELTVNFPDGVRLRPLNNNYSPSKSNHNTPFSAANTFINQELVYAPVYIRIKYTVKNPRNGLLFNGGLQTNVPRDNWCCYTVNNDMNFSASCWVPCIDNLYEKNTWEINVSVPKTVGDIGDSKIIGTKEADIAMRKQQRKDDEDYEEEEDNSSGIDLDREIVVVSPELLNFTEVPHTTDFSKKICSFQIYSPTAAQHVGFAIGPFESFPLLGIDEELNEVKDPEAENPELPNNVSNVSKNVYFLPGEKNDTLNTCIFLSKAMDFYSKEFGSYPFNSYSILFVRDLPSTSCGFAGLSIVSDKVVYAADKVEPIWSSTETLSYVLAEQWSGVNVVPKTHNDIWCVLGIAQFMASQFLKKLFGLNEFKYRSKLRSDLICDQDIRKRPLADQFFRFPINTENDLQFIKLKASQVMIILDRRMTKTDKSFGLSRVIPKLFLQAMSSDLFNGNCLSTYHFKHVCEKVNHNRLDNFFKNWVYSSGTPVLRISQKFNKKRMVIELTVRQVQIQELNNRNDEGMLVSGLSSESRHSDQNFIDDSLNALENEELEFNVPSVFQGPMTIRVHEADGTPYEHIVELKDAVSKLDIPYNTKNRRTKRGRRKQLDLFNEEDLSDPKALKELMEELRVNCFGDVLQSPEEIRSWNLQDWSNKDDEDSQAQDSFEWIRVDADFEWICKVDLIQPDYMFYSQLQQDRDVEAQIESVRFFSNVAKPTSLYSSILTRTLMDKRYFYGVRVEAVKGLGKLAKEDLGFIGMHHLLRCFQEIYCFKVPYNIMAPLNENNFLTSPNDFEDFGSLFVLKTIPRVLANVRLPSGEVPLKVRKILLNLLKFNDNLNNKFDDCFYMADIIEALFTAICNSGGFLVDEVDPEVAQFMVDFDTELKRIIKLDRLLPSSNSVVTKEILKQKIKSSRLGLYRLTYKELLSYTLTSVDDDLRLVAFEGLLTLGGLKNKDVLHYFFTVSKVDFSQRLKYQLIRVFANAITIAAIHGTPSYLDDPEFDEFYFSHDLNSNAGNGLNGLDVIFTEDSTNKFSMNSRKDAFARATIAGAISVLRRDYAFGLALKEEVWSAIHSNLLSIALKRCLFDVCEILFEPRNSFLVTIDKKNTKKVVAKIGKVEVPEDDSLTKVYEVIFQRKGRLKIHIPSFTDKKKAKVKVEATPTVPKIKLAAGPGAHARSNSKTSIKLAVPTSSVPKPVVKAPPKISSKASTRLVSLKFTNPSSRRQLAAFAKPLNPVPSHVKIIRASANLPLRFVKINTKKSVKLSLSSDPFPDLSNGDIDMSERSSSVQILENDPVAEPPKFKISINTKKFKVKTEVPAFNGKLESSDPMVPVETHKSLTPDVEMSENVLPPPASTEPVAPASNYVKLETTEMAIPTAPEPVVPDTLPDSTSSSAAVTESRDNSTPLPKPEFDSATAPVSAGLPASGSLSASLSASEPAPAPRPKIKLKINFNKTKTL